MSSVHASVVSVRGAGVLIRGAAGAGKSSLVLALVDDPRGDALLCADDRAILRRDGDRILAAVPEPLRGLLEVRGVGIVARPYRPEIALRLVVDLVGAADAQRLPGPDEAVADLLGVTLPRLALPPHGADAALRVRAMLRRMAMAGE